MKKSGMAGLMKQAQKLQENMARAQAELELLEVEGSAGGGVVTVKANGKQEVLEIKIDQDVIDPEDKEMLEDLITAAVNQALKNAREASEEKMAGAAGGLMGGLPPGFKIPGF
ncbi:YbaB/EbfC family nucleoid-associated protein [bacterium]|nr:YbaB/EbfC family nucleoid-associated protein [bacterium]MBU1651434.1 YbaB/EbfC family nucleoid-associated protein [bacterium]